MAIADTNRSELAARNDPVERFPRDREEFAHLTEAEQRLEFRRMRRVSFEVFMGRIGHNDTLAAVSASVPLADGTTPSADRRVFEVALGRCRAATNYEFRQYRNAAGETSLANMAGDRPRGEDVLAAADIILADLDQRLRGYVTATVPRLDRHRLHQQQVAALWAIQIVKDNSFAMQRLVRAGAGQPLAFCYGDETTDITTLARRGDFRVAEIIKRRLEALPHSMPPSIREHVARHVAHVHGDGCGRVVDEAKRWPPRKRCDDCNRRRTSAKAGLLARLEAQLDDVWPWSPGASQFVGACAVCGEEFVSTRPHARRHAQCERPSS